MSHRKHLIRLVHVGAKVVGMDEEARRAMQLRVTGRASCRDMDEPRLRAVVRELNRLGAKLTMPAPKPAGSDRAPLLGKLRAIMQADAHAEAYVLGISRAMWGEQSPEDLAWHSPKQLRSLIAALMYHRRRRAKERASA